MDGHTAKEKPFVNCWPKVILLGDSITERGYDAIGGWISLLSSRLNRKADIIKRGFSGYNTFWAAAFQADLFAGQSMKEVAAVVIALGANDSWQPVTQRIDQHVPLDAYGQNLRTLVNYFLSRGLPSSRLILLSPTPYARDDWIKFKTDQGVQLKQDKTNRSIAEYAKCALQIADELHVQAVDMFQAFIQQQACDLEQLFVDGLHLSQAGAKLFEEQLGPHLELLVDKFRRTAELNLPIYSSLLTDEYLTNQRGLSQQQCATRQF